MGLNKPGTDVLTAVLTDQDFAVIDNLCGGRRRGAFGRAVVEEVVAMSPREIGSLAHWATPQVEEGGGIPLRIRMRERLFEDLEDVCDGLIDPADAVLAAIRMKVAGVSPKTAAESNDADDELNASGESNLGIHPQTAESPTGVHAGGRSGASAGNAEVRPKTHFEVELDKLVKRERRNQLGVFGEAPLVSGVAYINTDSAWPGDTQKLLDELTVGSDTLVAGRLDEELLLWLARMVVDSGSGDEFRLVVGVDSDMPGAAQSECQDDECDDECDDEECWDGEEEDSGDGEEVRLSFPGVKDAGGTSRCLEQLFHRIGRDVTCVITTHKIFENQKTKWLVELVVEID